MKTAQEIIADATATLGELRVQRREIHERENVARSLILSAFKTQLFESRNLFAGATWTMNSGFDFIEIDDYDEQYEVYAKLSEIGLEQLPYDYDDEMYTVSFSNVKLRASSDCGIHIDADTPEDLIAFIVQLGITSGNLVFGDRLHYKMSRLKALKKELKQLEKDIADIEAAKEEFENLYEAALMEQKK